MSDKWLNYPVILNFWSAYVGHYALCYEHYKKNKKKKLSNFLQLFIKVIMVSSSHKPCFIYGQKVIDSVVGTPSINACSCNFWEIYTGNKTKSSSSKPL